MSIILVEKKTPYTLTPLQFLISHYDIYLSETFDKFNSE